MTQPRLPKKSNRHWSAKFADAFRGLKFGWTESSFLVHIVFAIAVIVCGFVFRVSQSEWLIVLLCIGVVMSAEMFNTAIESLARAVDQNAESRYRPGVRYCKRCRLSRGHLLSNHRSRRVPAAFACFLRSLTFFWVQGCKLFHAEKMQRPHRIRRDLCGLGNFRLSANWPLSLACVVKIRCQLQRIMWRVRS